ncbi:AI-2E family transporter [Cellulomonas bogoriensis]|uniref:Membrane protein n=1 Tax=Cellulomonas bogoriensis 69B4 = DSM 16987 TaxID=1386082 RepID=A0A0A0BM32_9CELL|nr:AI-2E family transporter [Cellulomonas bogoriensis]KGM08955.1 membrane protein [Cellulomonas bogoriensis 69B4 = DSM 16987]
MAAREAVPLSVRVAAAWSWRLILIGVVVGALVFAMATAKVIWVPVVVALLLTVLLTPVVEFLTGTLRFPRGLAATTTVVGLVAVVGGLLTLAGQQIAQGFAALWDQALDGFQELLLTLEDTPLGIDSEQLSLYLDQLVAQIGDNSNMLVSGALSVTTTIGQVLIGVVIALFCLLFFLKDGKIIWAWLLRLLPAGGRHRAYEASRRGVVTLGSYVRAQILVALVDAVGIGIGAAILGLPLVIPLMVLIFLASFIPFVGAIATGAIAVLVALVDQGLGTALIMLLIVIGVQQLESNVLQPLLLGHAVSLHPVAVLLAVTLGSISAGIVGALLAVPITATLNTVVLYLHGRDKFPYLGLDPGGLDGQLARLDGPGARVRARQAG